MDIKMIAIDLDGTALMPDHKSLSPGLCSALEAVYQKGVLIVPVTGRQLELLPAALQENPIWQSYIILCNGGQIWNTQTKRFLYSLTIPHDQLRLLLSITEDLDLPIEFSVHSRLYLTPHALNRERSNPGLAFHCNSILKKCGNLTDSLLPLCQSPEMPVEKVNISCISPEKKGLLLARLHGMDISAVWASDQDMEITPAKATKGTGVQALCQILGFATNNVMALGDSGNDISMLQLAGLGVAMGNAPDFVKQSADYVTKPNTQGGAAYAIERFVLKHSSFHAIDRGTFKNAEHEK